MSDCDDCYPGTDLLVRICYECGIDIAHQGDVYVRNEPLEGEMCVCPDCHVPDVDRLAYPDA